MKKLIQVRKEVASIIQHGSYSLQEVKPDVIVLEWTYERKEVQAILISLRKILSWTEIQLICLVIVRLRRDNKSSYRWICGLYF